MQVWRKNRNYRKYKNADGSFTYVITVDGEKIEVSETIYREYASLHLIIRCSPKHIRINLYHIFEE